VTSTDVIKRKLLQQPIGRAQAGLYFINPRHVIGLVADAVFYTNISITVVKMSPAATNTNSNGAAPQADSKKLPYQGLQPYGMPDDLVIPGIMDIDGTDERLWVPQAPDVTFRPLILCTSQGYFVNILRVKKSGILSRHQHTGPVHAFTLKGKWHYLEHECKSTGGTGCSPCLILMHIRVGDRRRL
jgi:hypothetical protein